MPMKKPLKKRSFKKKYNKKIFAIRSPHVIQINDIIKIIPYISREVLSNRKIPIGNPIK